MALIPGKEVDIGGVKYTLPPINLAMRRQFKDFLTHARSFSDGGRLPTNEDIMQMGDVVRGAFARNYPEADFVKLEGHLDDLKLVECFLAVMLAGTAGPAAGETAPGKS